MTDGWKIGILAALVVVGLASHFFLENRAVAKAVIVTQTKVETEYKTKLIAAQALAAQQTSALNAYKIQADKEKKDAVKDINAQLTSALSQLQERPTRADLTSSVATAVASARKSCTGAQLFREDGEFLAREAARADKVIVDRDYYYNAYESARKLLAGTGTNAGLNGKAANPIVVP